MSPIAPPAPARAGSVRHAAWRLPVAVLGRLTAGEMLMGPVDEITGCWSNLNHPFIEVEDTALAMIRFRNGALGNIVASVSQKPGIHTKVHIHGSNGASVGVETDTGASFIAGMTDAGDPPINDLWTIPGEEHRLAEFESEDRRRAPDIDPARYYHRMQMAAFIDAIAENRPPEVSGEDGREVVRMIQAVYQSGNTRQPVSL